MKHVINQIRARVRREGADRYLLLTLLSFAVSVAATRLFLELTGYPQLGGGELHIAHVLWGGLLLFVAALLPLVYANRWVYRLGSVLAGVGVGLFIDEVGKFITQTNDYFYPAAAPIIYAFFLVTVIIYLRIRRQPMRSVRAELYAALEGMQELLDHDLDPQERKALVARLEFVAGQARHPNLAQLGSQLQTFLRREELELVEVRPDAFDRWMARWLQIEQDYLTEWRTRAALVGVLLALGGWALYAAAIVLVPNWAISRLGELVLVGRLASASQLNWFAAQLALQTTVGLILLAGGLLLASGRRNLAVSLGTLGLLLALGAVNLLVFYFDQFSTIMKAGVELLALLGLIRYRDRFIPPEESLPPVS
jgi:hypothetical protein